MVGGDGKRLRTHGVAMIGMDGELEYLIKAWKRVCKSLQNAEAVGAITVERCKDIGATGSSELQNQWELCGWKGTNSELEKDKIR